MGQPRTSEELRRAIYLIDSLIAPALPMVGDAVVMAQARVVKAVLAWASGEEDTSFGRLIKGLNEIDGRRERVQ